MSRMPELEEAEEGLDGREPGIPCPHAVSAILRSNPTTTRIIGVAHDDGVTFCPFSAARDTCLSNTGVASRYQ